MSVKIMSAVFDSQTLAPTERLIMLALADHADDEGRCYPSISRLCNRTGLSERAVQTNIRKLQEQGYIRIIPSAGKSGANVYFVSPTPAADAPPAGNAPRSRCTTPPQEVRPTPAADAPKPSGTIIEPSKEDQSDHLFDDLPVLRFDDFWNGWPMAKVGKQKAKSAFQRLSAANQRLAVEKVGIWSAAWRRQNPTASDIHPTTYLNGKRWEDEFSPQAPQLRAVGGTTSRWGKL